MDRVLTQTVAPAMAATLINASFVLPRLLSTLPPALVLRVWILTAQRAIRMTIRNVEHANLRT